MREPNHDKLNELVGKLVGDLGASLAGASILLGDRLGLYKAMADGVPVTSVELAKKTGLHERYVREWLVRPGGVRLYRLSPGDKNTFSLSPEQAMAFAEEGSPGILRRRVRCRAIDLSRRAQSRRGICTGKGVGWHEHSKVPVLRHRALLPAGL